jgi:PAS domain S-box-containing protein
MRSGSSAATAQSLESLGHWQLAATLFTTICGLILIGFLIAGYRRLIAHFAEQQQQQETAWQRTFHELREQIASQKKREVALEDECERLTDQFMRADKSYHDIKDELDRRKLAEEVFSQQKRELVRSKDVLELHVQARAQQLQKLQRAYELILNSAGEGICGLDTEGKVTFANPAAAKMMSVQVNELVGQSAKNAFPDFMQATATAKADSSPAPVEIITTRRDGTKFGAEVLRNPIRENDRLVGEVLLFKDITERKLADEALARKATELARSNAELEQFAFVASHDLQEPLRKIQAFGDRLKAKCDAVNLQEGRDYLERMQSAAARMQTLIFDLLTFSRVISRTEPFAPINLNSVIRDILSDLEVRIEKTGGKVEVGDLPTIEGDSTQLRQLLQNLIGNALKFHAPGKPPVVKVNSRMLPASPAFAKTDGQGNPSSPMCEITVADNGIGFDEKYLEKIFAVFQRLHGRQEYEGTGIGLAVCRRIVDRHNGKITAQSKPGEGATFIITLPLKQPQAASNK